MNLRSGEYIYIYHLQHRTNLTKRNTIIFSRLKIGIKKKKWKMIRDRQTKKRVLRRGEQLHFDLSEKSTHTQKKTFRAPHAAKQLNNLVSCVPCTEPANNNKSRVISTYFCYFYENQLAVFLFAWSLFCFFVFLAPSFERTYGFCIESLSIHVQWKAEGIKKNQMPNRQRHGAATFGENIALHAVLLLFSHFFITTQAF